MDNQSKILSSFELQNILNPKIWISPNSPEVKMKTDIRDTLLEIAYQFMDFMGVEVFVEDIVMTGSLANYNWSSFSDVDLHLMIDYSQFPKEQWDIYKELFNIKKILFNNNHNITVKGYDVELYAQDSSEEHTSSGIYSVLFDEWIEKPKKEEVTIDKKSIKNKAIEWMGAIDKVIENASEEDLDNAKKLISKYKDKLKKYRKSGLEKKGEYSNENLVFKFLRRNGYIEKLYDFENEIMDKNLSLSEFNNTIE
jgi:predicted nucleotidyltransferase